MWSVTKDAKLEEAHVFTSPSTTGVDGVKIAGVLKMEYNASKNELLSLGADRRVTFWDLSGDKEMIRQL